MSSLSAVERKIRAKVLWDALADVASSVLRRLDGGDQRAQLAVRDLKETAWIPCGDGDFRVPSEVSFETLEWRIDRILLYLIPFRPAVIDQLAKSEGFEPGVLHLLKKHRLTNKAAIGRLLSVVRAVTGEGRSVGGVRPSASQEAPARRGPVPFESYVAVDRDGDGDPDGLARQARMALEEAAIKEILSREPAWKRTPPCNEGFDLFRVASDGQQCSWCEVKAMKGCLQDRPATLSRAQFKFAQTRGEAYWLYVVEHAGSGGARIVRIQDPAGKAKTFTFDRGWLDVAEVD